MGVVAGEAAFPRWDLPRARVNLFIRILVTYLSSAVFVSVLVPYTEPLLLSTSNLASSPFVIAMNYAGIRVLSHIVNVVLLICLCGIGSEELFVASRIQTAMAEMGMMPKIFNKIDKKGRPWVSLLCCSLMAIAFTYMCLSTTGAIAFNWFSSISATTTFFAWMIIPVTNWCMRRALKAQGDEALSEPFAYTVHSGRQYQSTSSSPRYSLLSVPSGSLQAPLEAARVRKSSSRLCSVFLSSLEHICVSNCGFAQSLSTLRLQT